MVGMSIDYSNSEKVLGTNYSWMNKTFLPEYLPLWDIQEVRTFRGGRPKAYESVLGEIVVIAQAYVRFLKNS